MNKKIVLYKLLVVTIVKMNKKLVLTKKDIMLELIYVYNVAHNCHLSSAG